MTLWTMPLSFQSVVQGPIDECTPIVVEVMIHTLGDYWTEDKPDAPSKVLSLPPRFGSQN